jgi:hypothetical protein
LRKSRRDKHGQQNYGKRDSLHDPHLAKIFGARSGRTG